MAAQPGMDALIDAVEAAVVASDGTPRGIARAFVKTNVFLNLHGGAREREELIRALIEVYDYNPRAHSLADLVRHGFLGPTTERERIQRGRGANGVLLAALLEGVDPTAPAQRQDLVSRPGHPAQPTAAPSAAGGADGGAGRG